LDDNLCLASAVSKYAQVLVDTLDQMAPIKSRLITIQSNASWYGDGIRLQLKKGLEESLGASGAGLNLNVID